MPEIGKNGVYSGFVPNHNHGSVDYTSVNDGHVHQYLFVTSPPIPGQDGGMMAINIILKDLTNLRQVTKPIHKLPPN